jgi:hypothetical protein
MPTIRIPLVGTFNQRGLSGNATLVLNEDQRFLNCVFEVVTNPVTGKSTVYVSKRFGWGVDSLVASGSASTGLIKPQSFNATITAFGDTNSTIYFGTTSVGAITGRALHFTETLISAVPYIMIRSSDGTLWYYVSGAKDVTAYTMDGNNSVNVTDIKIAGANNTAGLYPGQLLTAGSNIVAGTRVVSVNSGAFTAVLDTATTGGAFNDVAVTKTPIAKVTSVNFVSTGTYISALAPMDGYLFYATDDGYVNNSDLNSAITYSANARIAAQQVPDPAVGVAIQKNTVIVFGTGSNEKFQNAGYSTGSPLQVSKTLVDHVGALDQRSITTIEDDIYWVSTPSEGDIGVYQMRGLQSKRISNPVVDRIMGTVSATGGAIYASSYRLGGQVYAAFFMSLASDGPASMILLESGDLLLLETGDDILLEDASAQTSAFARMMIYNATLNIWAESDCVFATFIDSVGSGSSNQIVATSRVSTSGKVYTINPASDGELYQDDGASYSMQVRTARLDHGTGKRKFIPEIRLICDRQSAGTATLEVSDDDYSSWTQIGTFDLTQMEPKVTPCGSYKGGRAYRVTHSYNGPFRAEALEFDYEVAM